MVVIRTVEQQASAFAGNRAIGKVALTVHARGGISRRARVHEHGSLRVRCPGAPGAELEAVLINTAGGIAGGDRFSVDINAGAGAHIIVTTAAAEKVYRSLAPAAEIDVRLTVGDGAALAWLPQETILFDRAKLRRTVEIDLAADARLLLAEAIVFGRSGMGETVGECELSDRWRLRRGGRLVHGEALRLDGAAAAKLRRAAVANGGIAVATVLLAPGDETATRAVRALEGQFRGEVGVSAWKGLAIARFCAVDGAALRHDLLLVLAVLRTAPLPRLWLN